jgi:hypothetical protein
MLSNAQDLLFAGIQQKAGLSLRSRRQISLLTEDTHSEAIVPFTNCAHSFFRSL